MKKIYNQPKITVFDLGVESLCQTINITSISQQRVEAYDCQAEFVDDGNGYDANQFAPTYRTTLWGD